MGPPDAAPHPALHRNLDYTIWWGMELSHDPQTWDLGTRPRMLVSPAPLPLAAHLPAASQTWTPACSRQGQLGRPSALHRPSPSASGHLPAFCLCPCQLSSTCPGRGCTITASCFWLGKTSQLSPGRAQCVSNPRSREGLRNQKWLLFTEPSTGQVFPRTLLFSSFSQA